MTVNICAIKEKITTHVNLLNRRKKYLTVDCATDVGIAIWINIILHEQNDTDVCDCALVALGKYIGHVCLQLGHSCFCLLSISFHLLKIIGYGI